MKKIAHIWSSFDIAVILCTLVLYGTAVHLLQPIVLPSTLSVWGTKELISVQDLHSPIAYKGLLYLNLNVRMRWIRPSTLHLEVYDCLLGLSMNGEQMVQNRLTKCDLTDDAPILQGTTMPRRGLNTLKITALNTTGKRGVRFTVPQTDPLMLALNLVLLGVIGLNIWKGIRKTPLWQKHQNLVWIFFGGMFLRGFYMLSTHIWERSYDWEGHWDYVLYVLQHWKIPLASEGWQYYQPPLYYFINALALSPATLFHDEYLLMRLAQVLSLSMSIAALGAGIWIGTLLFRSEEKQKRLLFAAGIAFFPGLVFHASRVSNDTLLLLISFLFFGFLYRWWMRGSERDLLIASVCAACGLLTKSSALPLAALLLFCAFTHELRMPGHWRDSLRNFLLCFSILFALTGWHYTLRFVVERNIHIIGNIGTNNPELFIDTIEAKNFYTFRPIAVLLQPFNNSYTDRMGRRFFWEHLTKSSLAGEWELGEDLYTIIQFLLMLMMLFAVFGIAGLMRTIRCQLRAGLPVLAAGAVLLGSMMALIIQKPVGGLQDFRYIPLLAVPVLYCILQGIDVLPKRVRNIPVLLLLSYDTLCVAFLIVLLAH
ncbi:hypothetical protein COU79_04950 [Candidatus Peregrinibacteria bacterium CG10_big_fil_rev_8_21_14_0_10_54_7]|nr:MAG: hypothetical protein COU79_04950 [Candidatus Peregrinibacteria bacterium CG10_big_fil_rev_8_21_14_0_10_54_7]